MTPRANWKGYLRLSLVSCPIALYPASSLSEKVSFNRINRKTREAPHTKCRHPNDGNHHEPTLSNREGKNCVDHRGISTFSRSMFMSG